MWHHRYLPQGGCPPQQQQFSPPPGQYPPQQHSYGAPPPGQYGAPHMQHYGGGPPATDIRKVESLATSRAESEDAMSTHDSSLPSETTDPCCYWCSRISPRDRRAYDPLPDEREQLQKLFHSDCKCRRRITKLPSSACGFCKHLNIRHLVRCVLLRDKLSLPTFVTDWYCRENLQSGCRLCEYIGSYGTSGPETRFDINNFADPLCHLFLPRADHYPKNYICVLPYSIPQLQDYVDWERIEKWVSDKHPEVMDLPVDFRVIDVERKCIVTPGHPVRYVALSYVWGKSAQKENPFQASMRNIEYLEIEGSLSGAPLPRTITDAMEVCRQLHRKYLWVDRLCIIQDDESKHGQIQRMDSIFGSSEFTIIALSGKDANDGLAGVSKPRKSRRLKILEWQGLTFSKPFPSIATIVQSSHWGTRGWTFQEEFCSSRNLYFTKYGVYYSSTDLDVPYSECLATGIDGATQDFYFPDSVEEYAERSFTYSGDLLRAFTGVLNMNYGHKHHFGNAYSGDEFSEWIHWQPLDWEYKARRPSKDISSQSASHIKPHKSDIFPSWSWTSVQGGVEFYHRAGSVALWAIPVDQESQEDSNVEWVSHDYDAYQLRKMTVEGGLMSVEEFPVQCDHDGRLISAPSTLFEKADRDEACKKLGRILSFTQIASLRLECFDDHFCDGRRTFRIISSSGRCIGGIFVPKLSLEYVFNRDRGIRDKEFKFIALGTHVPGWNENVDRTLKGVGLKDRKGREVMNVMLIWQAKDSNVSRRLGIGHVYQDKWLKERPVLKTIILE